MRDGVLLVAIGQGLSSGKCRKGGPVCTAPQGSRYRYRRKTQPQKCRIGVGVLGCGPQSVLYRNALFVQVDNFRMTIRTETSMREIEQQVSEIDRLAEVGDH